MHDSIAGNRQQYPNTQYKLNRPSVEGIGSEQKEEWGKNPNSYKSPKHPNNPNNPNIRKAGAQFVDLIYIYIYI